MYACKDCEYIAKSYPAAIRHSKGVESVRADSTPERPAHTEGWPFGIRHRLELIPR